MQNALPHDSDAIADRQGFSRIMGDDHAAGATGVQHRSELTSQSQPHLHIQTGKGLIQEHNPWSWGQGSRQGQPLTLTTGQLVRVTLLQSM